MNDQLRNITADPSGPYRLEEVILRGGIAHTHFFNGRVLTAEAMQAEQEAQRRQRRLLGRAVGSGVAHGLTVAIKPAPGGAPSTILTIGAGLAVNPRGQALALPEDIELAVVRQETLSAPGPGAGQFGECFSSAPPAVPTGVGVYLLLLAPAVGEQGRAPMSSLNGNGRVDDCGSRYQVEGVAFRLLRFDPTGLPGIDGITRARLIALLNRTDPAGEFSLRNLLVHLCFGTAEQATLPRDPLAAPVGAGYGALDALRSAGCLSDDDVPLALIYWTRQGLRFADLWAVRRRPALPAAPEPRERFVNARRQAEAEALWLQFQDQLAALSRAVPDLGAVAAREYFRYLPPVGLVPLAASGGGRGFTARTFFDGLAYRDPARRAVYLEGAAVEPLIRAALAYPPLDLDRRELVWLYWVRENLEPGSPAAPPYLLFTSGHVSLQGPARYDVARFDFSNYRFAPLVAE
jgi:hypothetical protein